jgi:DegV family protein with EDD domain
MAPKIVTDSTSDLTPEVAQELGIAVVPLYVHFGSEAYRDGVDLTTQDFYHRLASANPLPKTAVASPATYAQVYDSLAEETDEILVIALSSKLSTVYEVELQAVELMKRKCRVEVVDSQAGAMALGLINIAAAKAAKAGAGLDELLDVTRRNISRSKICFAFDTLEYLRRGGRIGAAQAFLGSLLKVNPVLTLRDGAAYPMAKPRSRTKAIDYLYNFGLGFSNIEEMAVEDATTPDEAEILVERLASRFPRERIHRAKVTPVRGTHVGPRVLGVTVLGDR